MNAVIHRYRQDAGRALLSILVFLLPATEAGQQAQTVTPTDLKAKPEPKASVLATLPRGSALVVSERKGGWYAADSAQGKGWVRLLHVRLAGVAQTGSSSNSAALASLAGSSRTDTTVATGIRGLTETDLQQASENPQELAKLDRFVVSAEEARKFAASGKVVSTAATLE